MRRIALLSALLLPATALSAQANLQIMGGYVSSTMSASSGTFSISPTSRSGFAAGVDLSGLLAENLHLAVEAIYVQKGFSVDGNSGSGSLRTNYIEVPVLLRVSAGQSTTRFFAFAGPHVAFRLSCSVSATSGSGSASTDCGNDANNNFKSTDYGLTVGAGVRMGNIGVQARYDLGLANLNGDNTDNTTIRNRAWLLLASVYLQ